MILPLYANLEKLDLRAARGRRRSRRHAVARVLDASRCRCRCPASSPAALLVFIPAVGEFVIPDAARRLRHADDRPRAVGRVLQQPRLADGQRRGDRACCCCWSCRSCCSSATRPRAGAPASMTGRALAASSPSMLAFGFAFLYVPIVSLIVYSFNDSRLVTVWARLLDAEVVRRAARQRRRCCDAAWLSLRDRRRRRACGAGHPRHARRLRAGALRGASAAARCSPAWSTAPLVMPEVITGLSLLLLFVAHGAADRLARGARHHHDHDRAHHASRMAYVTVVVQSRLADFDQSLEEAAHGSRRAAVHGVLASSRCR